MIRLITDYLDQTAIKYPNKMAFEDADRRMTYVELQQMAYRVADHLIKKGVLHKPIAIFMEKNVASIAVLLGIAYSGNFYIILDINAPILRMQNILQDLEPKFIVTNKKNQEKLDEINCETDIVLFEDIEEELYNIERIKDTASRIKGSDIVYVIYTSGSTGNPKGVITPHRAVIENIEAASKCYYQDITDKDVFGNQYPLFYVAAIEDIFPSIRNGASTYLIPPSLFYSPGKLVTFLHEKKITIIDWVPSALAIIANSDALNGVDLSGIRKIIFGGESMSPGILNYWRKALPDAVFINCYGATETTSGTTYYIVDSGYKDVDELPLGKPLGHLEIILVDENGMEAKQGEIGEMYVRTSALSYGYYKDLEKTKSVFVQNPINKTYLDMVYKTGDLAKQDEDGNYIYIGRVDSQIKIGGHRIELGDIEKNVLEIDGIEECVCLYKKEKEDLILYYKGEVQEKELYEHLKIKLPINMIPSKYYRIETFPLNANGKIDKVKLMDLLEDDL